MTEAVRVVIADDHPPTRQAVAEVLEGSGFEVCATAHGAESAVAAVREYRPDVALLDIHMPGNGILAAAEIAADFEDVAIVMLTVSRGDDDLFAALKAGASGYLLKDTDPERLPEALRAILRGDAILPRALLARIGQDFKERERRGGRSDRREASLSSREWEVLALLSEGLTTAEISDRLFIAKVTVRSHIASIMKQLRVSSREEAIALIRGKGR